MKIGIIDADLLGRQKHRFPNLACEKISGYWKSKGAEVHLLLDYNFPEDFDQIYISKVFTDTEVPEIPSNDMRIKIGGTGFFFDQAPNLHDEIEHHMPDYDLYNDWIEEEIVKAESEAISKGEKFSRASYIKQFKEYTDYSIGFLTRGCFRKCEFCVNQKYDHVFTHSPLAEFFDTNRKRICLLDDNFLGCPRWKELLQELIDTGRPFKFKQGIDERLLSDERCQLLFNSKYDGDFTFAFDNVEDYELIENKLRLIRKYTHTRAIKFYVLVGFKGIDEMDIRDAFRRIKLLMKYQCLPYLMRYQDRNDAPWKRSKWKGLYVAMARWCNQPSIFKKMSFRQFCEANQALRKNQDKLCSSMKAMDDFIQQFPQIANQYFDLRYDNYLLSNLQ